MFEHILNEIKKHSTIIIHRHKNPDGDAIGSQIGLKHLLIHNFPEKKIYAVGDSAGNYSFMEDSTPDRIDDSVFNGALSIILDSGSPHLISDDRYTLAARTARIDHHIFSEKIADVEVIDTSFESCCGEIAALAMESGLKLNTLSAKSLYTGMVTDSGRFRFDPTTSRTFTLAAFLMEQEIDTTEIFSHLYADEYASRKLKAQFTLKIQFTPKNVAYIYTTLDELKASGADTFTVSRGMVGTMADMKSVDIWVNFTETENGVIAELRSSKYNINPIAVKYGGGGHAKASGATLKDRAQAIDMLSDLDDLIGE